MLDMAHNLIRLYGYEPGRDIEVRIIGLRPGREAAREPRRRDGATRRGSRRRSCCASAGAPWTASGRRDLLAVLEWCLEERDEARGAARAPRPRAGLPARAPGAARSPRAGGLLAARRSGARAGAVVSVLAIVPARAGSRSIPDKNIVSFRGKPLLVHSVEHGLAARNVDRVIVSTDSPALPRDRRGRRSGGALPAPGGAGAATSRRTSRSSPTPSSGWRRHEGYRPEACVHLRPTHPTRSVSDVERAVDLLLGDPTRRLRAIGGEGAPHALQDVARSTRRRPPAPPRGARARGLEPAPPGAPGRLPAERRRRRRALARRPRAALDDRAGGSSPT